MVYISNAFSLSMINWPADLRVKSISLDEIREVLGQGFVSAVGHEPTAKLFSALLGVEIPCNRVQIKLAIDDFLIVGQVMQRLPEGKVLTQEEIAQVPIAWAKVIVHHGWASGWAYDKGISYQVWLYGLPPGLYGYSPSGDRYPLLDKINEELGLPVDLNWKYHEEHPWLGVLVSDIVPEDK